MPWRRKPAQFLRYWTGPVDRNAGFKTVLVFCVGANPTFGAIGGTEVHIGLFALVRSHWRFQCGTD